MKNKVKVTNIKQMKNQEPSTPFATGCMSGNSLYLLLIKALLKMTTANFLPLFNKNTKNSMQ